MAVLMAVLVAVTVMAAEKVNMAKTHMTRAKVLRQSFVAVLPTIG
jgi:hypothetical protein